MKASKSGLVAIAALVLVANALYFWHARRVADNTYKDHLAYGAVFPSVALRSLQGETLNWSSKYLMLIFFQATSEEGLRRANHVDSLYRQYRAQGLEAIAVMNGTAEEVEKRVQQSGISYPVVVSNRELDKALVFEDHEYEIFFVGPDNHVLFSSVVFMPDDLRQLTERYLTGHISYFSSLDQSHLQIGDKFPVFLVQDVAHNRSGPVDISTHKTVIIISASCSACSLAPGTEIISKWVKDHATTSENQPLVIFSSKFTNTEVQTVMPGLKADVVHAQEPIPLVENRVSLNGLFDKYILVLSLDNGVVTNLTSIM